MHCTAQHTSTPQLQCYTLWCHPARGLLFRKPWRNLNHQLQIRIGDLPPRRPNDPSRSKSSIFSPQATISLTRSPNSYMSIENASQVKIIVGPERKAFLINEALLCETSDFFHAAFRGGFREASEKEMELPEESPESFGLFINWLYSHTINNIFDPPDFCRRDPLSEEKEGGIGTKAFLEFEKRILKLWIFSEKFLLQPFFEYIQDDIVTLNYRAFEFQPESIAFVWENTSEDSPIRKFLVDMAVEGLCHNKWMEMAKFFVGCSSDFNREALASFHAHLEKDMESCEIIWCEIHYKNGSDAFSNHEWANRPNEDDKDAKKISSEDRQEWYREWLLPEYRRSYM